MTREPPIKGHCHKCREQFSLPPAPKIFCPSCGAHVGGSGSIVIAEIDQTEPVKWFIDNSEPPPGSRG